LSNSKSTPEALKARIGDKAIALFKELNILTAHEIKARYEIEIESYVLRIQIESRVLGDIARSHIIPTAIRYQNILITNVLGLTELYGNTVKNLGTEQSSLIEQISEHMAQINVGVSEMISARKKSNAIDDAEKKAIAYCEVVLPYIQVIREHCDKLELLVDDELWPLTKYRELLFIK